jgi:hypothetical protein
MAMASKTGAEMNMLEYLLYGDTVRHVHLILDRNLTGDAPV